MKNSICWTNSKILFQPFLLVIIFLLAGFIYSCSSDTDPRVDVELTKTNPRKVLNEFGFYSDSLVEFTSVVKQNQTLTDLLLPFEIPYIRITEMAKYSKGKFNVRKINPGHEYKVFSLADSSKSVEYFIYKTDPINYVVFDLTDSVNIYKVKKEITISERELSGTITSSLYETMQKINAHINLALKLSEVYAWQIDFYRIMKGDNFRVIYEEEFVDGKYFRIGKIKAAYFFHAGEPYYAFYFKQEGKDEYFDEKGNSLQKQFLKAPLKFSRISSRYSGRRFHPILKRFRAHRGIDYAAPAGTPVRSVGDGIVIEKKYNRSSGYHLKIRHNSTYSSGYLHLSKYAKGIKKGSSVHQGDVIGYVGSTGLATGPHLDLRFWKHGSLVNYLTQKFPSSHPINKKNREEFYKEKEIMIMRLDLINKDFQQYQPTYTLK